MIRQLTTDLYNSIMLDMPLRPAMIVDFGVKTDAHYSALQRAVRAGGEMQELDEALGNGQKLTTFVKKYVPTSTIVFKTYYDEIAELEDEQIKQLESKDVLTEDEREILNELYENKKDR